MTVPGIAALWASGVENMFLYYMGFLLLFVLIYMLLLYLRLRSFFGKNPGQLEYYRQQTTMGKLAFLDRFPNVADDQA